MQTQSVIWFSKLRKFQKMLKMSFIFTPKSKAMHLFVWCMKQPKSLLQENGKWNNTFKKTVAIYVKLFL